VCFIITISITITINSLRRVIEIENFVNSLNDVQTYRQTRVTH